MESKKAEKTATMATETTKMDAIQVVGLKKGISARLQEKDVWRSVAVGMVWLKRAKNAMMETSPMETGVQKGAENKTWKDF